MALEENEGRKIYLNIKEGRIHYKDPKTGEKKDTGTVSGVITGCQINQKEWEGKKYEEASLTIVDGTEKYILQLSLNKGYFRAFVNQMKSGDPTQRVKIAPSYKVEGTVKNGSMFIEQNGKSLPWYSKKGDMKDVPPGEPVEIDGEVKISRTKQMNYWKEWLNSVKWGSEFEASSITPMPNHEAKATAHSNVNNQVDNPLGDDNEDLPF
jgi:hypothetical protein